MNERELRILRAIVDNLRALRQEIGEYQRTKKDTHNNEPIQPLPVEITATPQLDPARQEYYDAKNRERHSPWSRIRPWAERFGFLIGLALLVLNIVTLRQVQRQADIAESQSRPWIKIVDISVVDPTNDTPALSFMTMPMVRPNKPRQEFTQTVANISLEITVKNIGRGVAQNVYIAPVLNFYRWNSSEVPGRDEERVCGEVARWNPGPPFAWSSIFPDETRKWRFMTGGFYDEETVFHPPDRQGKWISGILFGCVSYQSPSGYRTIAVFDVMGEKDRFVEVGKPVMSKQIHLLRDEHYEYAQ